MTMFIDVPLWEDPTPEPIFHEDDFNMIRLGDDMFQCRDCKEIVKGEYVWQISHGMAFNGWCFAHLLCNNGANPDQLEWLEAHGFQKVDRFDQAFWNLP